MAATIEKSAHTLLSIPDASPLRITVAEPVRVDSAISCTAPCLVPVAKSVM